MLGVIIERSYFYGVIILDYDNYDESSSITDPSGFFAELESIYSDTNSGEADKSADSLLAELNAEQKAAVSHLDGPLLILAGAGSGKTRVITYRIAYMMKKHSVQPSSILAITFTNKAANEMKERITALVGDRARYIWCGTFHSIFARILRRHAELIGYSDNFTIVDTDDQVKLIKDSMKELDIPESKVKPKSVQYEISSCKNHMISPEEFKEDAAGDVYRLMVAKIYKRYSEKLVQNNIMDFDDILLNMSILLENNPDVLDFYNDKFKYIMVDEYQDTNLPQYRAIMLLASKHKNICVVGDDDQSIYSFRGADVRMILNFEKDFPGCKVIKLEENYRSTKTILEAANEVIANNTKRKSKALRTSGAQGDKIIVMNADDQVGEAYFVANTIKTMKQKGKFGYSDCAILYRVNALSRSVESALREKGIPFKVYGGLRFYDRKEIKDILAYLRLINDSKDNLAFERIINVPKRSIGDTTVEKIREIAIEENRSMFDICRDAASYSELSRVSAKLLYFVDLIDKLRAPIEEKSFRDYVEYVENESGIIEEIIAQREKKGEVVDRVENLKELLTEAAEFEKNHRVEKDEDELPVEITDDLDELENRTASTTSGLLTLYLENAALYTEGDSNDESEDFVRLMSIHSAKGLEFGSVFLIGVEESVFPSYRSITSEEDLEEERRLMYVAITRAKKNLFVIMTRQRMLFGQTQYNMPSRFMREIDPALLYKMGAERKPAKTDDAVVPMREDARKSIANALSSGFRKEASKKPKEGLTPDQIKAGMEVKHDRFGIGKVLKVEPVGGDALVTVDFDGMRKNMLLNSAGLKKV